MKIPPTKKKVSLKNSVFHNLLPLKKGVFASLAFVLEKMDCINHNAHLEGFDPDRLENCHLNVKKLPKT